MAGEDTNKPSPPPIAQLEALPDEKPKEIRTSALLIQEWDTNSDNDSVFRPKHIPAKINFVKAVFTRSGRIPVSDAKPKAVASTSVAKPVNTVGPKQSVNFLNSRSNFHKSHSPIRRSFYNATTHSRSNSTERVHTTGSKAIIVVKGNGVTVVKASAGKFEGKADEGFLVGYSVTSKDFRVFNTKTYKVEENMHVRFLENKPNVERTGPNSLFDIGSLTNSMNYIPVSAGNQTEKNAGPQDTNGNAGTQDNVDAGKEVYDQHHIMLPLWSSISSNYKSSDDKAEDDKPK
nr:retrovirus-related Pol polyprotein from transposon TNT 1-94 [Tanacetum cinerariifolium]